MILSMFRKKRDQAPISATYASIVAQSRHPVFYADWGVPDTVTGRFDMISLHLALVFRRLRSQSPAADLFAQELLDLFFSDMDRSLRSMGVGDLSVGKKVRRMSEVFFGLLASLDGAMEQNFGSALEEVLTRNIYAENGEIDPGPLAAYLRASARRLSNQPTSEIIAGFLALEPLPGAMP